jgi:hypothetical protein
MKLTYNDTSHAYYLDGRRAKSVTAVAKIPTDQYAINKWHERMTAIGTAIDPNIRENIARHIDNKDALNDLCEEAKKIAKAHHAADRGSQMHRVLELVLLDQEHKLLTDQQRADAEVLKRTLDHYHLTPYDYLTEQFVAWPHYTLCGRFDAVLEKPGGALILTDLKSGPNAITYPHSVSVQLALYARAPHISDNIHTQGDKSTVTDWREMPQRLDYRRGYVLLVEPDAKIGTLHEIDIEHGWAAAQMALHIIEWRKQLSNGKDIVREVPAQPIPDIIEQLHASMFISLAQRARTVEELRDVWETAKHENQITAQLLDACTQRKQQLTEGAA